MGLLDPVPPPYDPLAWREEPLETRGRMVCEAWAKDGYGTPLAVYAVYALKIAFYIGAWLLACRLTPSLGGPSTIGAWWLEPVAFHKAIVLSLLFEVLGLGCGSGPLTGRYLPPVGGVLYFLRPGTTKLPLLRALGVRRTWLDVSLYAALLVACGHALAAPSIGIAEALPIVVLVPLLGVLDKTIFLAARAEHYWVMCVCFLFASDWIAGAKAVQLALWFWAGVSKLNHHFPSVVCVMTSNSPFTRFAWLRRLMYRGDADLRPSRVAVVMAHAGTALELAVPTVLVLAPEGPWLVVGIALMLILHAFITSNVPMGVPLEWNVMVVYGGFALFWAHPDVSVLDVGSPALAGLLVIALVVVPILGNVFPERFSFLLAMRYYAGNWAYGVWLFRGESHQKLRRLTASAGWVYDQLDRFYDRATAVGLVGKVLGFRLMHLHGRALPVLIPKAVERFEEYEYLDGEIVAGQVLGWNFGDGHLHAEQLLEAVQAQCDFEDGELRCVFVESQPLFRSGLRYRIVDARRGRLEEGELSVDELRARQPWSST